MAVPYLTADEVRAAVPSLQDDARFEDAKLASYVAEFEGKAEHYRGVAFTPRTCVESMPVGSGTTGVVLSWPKARGITSIELDDVALTVGTYRLGHAGSVELSSVLYVSGGFATGVLVVEYEHGFDAPDTSTPMGSVLLAACAEYVKSVAMQRLKATGREIIATASDGVLHRFSTPDIRAGRPTGWLEVDQLLNSLPDFRYPVFC